MSDKRTEKFLEEHLLKFGNTIQLVGAIYQGEGQTILVYFPYEEADPNSDFQHWELDRAQWERFLRQTDLLETEVLQRAKDGTVTKAILRKSQRQIEQSTSWHVFKRDSFHCRYCGDGDSPLTVDHVITWESGGPSIPANLLSSCRRCNRLRGNTPYPEWLQSDTYKRRSQGLSKAVQAANEALVATLDKIPLMVTKRSR